MTSVNIAIIGGGASGLFFAMTAADLLRKEKKRFNINITVFEKESRIGRKLSATGNGKCNLTNTALSGGCYSGSFAKYGEKLFKAYNTDYILNEFKKYGLFCTDDGSGRVYPYSRQASAVLDCMLIALANSGVTVCCDTKITELKKAGKKYSLTSNKGTYIFDYAVIAVGGKASPNLGSDGSAYTFIKELGIIQNTCFPSLCPIPVTSKKLKSLKGIRCRCSVTLTADDRKVKTEYGELQITEKALSGICIFQLSRFVNEFFASGTVCGRKAHDIAVYVDLFPDIDEEKLFGMLKERRKTLKDITVGQLFTGLINQKLGNAVYSDCSLKHKSADTVAQLNDGELKTLAHKLKSWGFTPLAMSDWSTAQVTAGGIAASQLNTETLECIKNKNLYCIGEAVDIDGCCGGYNLHWAWTSALVAAKYICGKIKNCNKIGVKQDDKNYRPKNAR